ncbi:MAG TPA: hypothetical protein VGK87_14660 [Anaerolineae bacterium]
MKGPQRPLPLTLTALIVVISVAWAELLAFNPIPQLRGDFGWRWPYEVPQSMLSVMPLVSGLVVYCFVGAWLLQRRSPAWLLIWAVLGTVGLTLAAQSIVESPLFKLYEVTVSPGTTSWHYAAATITDINQTLREWPAFMQLAAKYSNHLGIVPPGAVLFYYELSQLLQTVPGLVRFMADPLRLAMCQNFELAQYSDGQLASAWFGMLMPLWGGLTVLPMYALGKRLFNGRTARWSVMWWPLIPSLLLFAGTLNTLFPLLAACDILLLVEGMRRGRWWLVLCAGLLASAMTFVSFAFFPLLFLAGVLVLFSYLTRNPLFSSAPLALAPKRAVWLWPFIIGLLYGAGLATVWVVYDIFTGVSFVDVLRTATAPHLALDRPYGPWLFLHLYDYFIFTGWPIVLLSGIAVVGAVARWKRNRTLSMGGLLAIASAATLLVLDVSGTMRGESGRILLFLTPFFLLCAADVISVSPRSGAVATLGQALIVVTMAAFLRVIGAGFNTPSPISPPLLAQESPRESFPSGAVFDGVLHLNTFSGYVTDVRDSKGGVTPTLKLWLEWQSSGQVNVPYWMSLLPVAPDGQLGQPLLRQPFDTAYPTTCWLPRSGLIREQVDVPLPATGNDGAYWVSLALLKRNGDHAPVLLPNGAHDVQTGLGAFYR